MENDRVVVARERERHASGLLLARVRTQMMDVYRPLKALLMAATQARRYMARELGFEWLTLTAYDRCFMRPSERLYPHLEVFTADFAPEFWAHARESQGAAAWRKHSPGDLQVRTQRRTKPYILLYGSAHHRRHFVSPVDCIAVAGGRPEQAGDLHRRPLQRHDPPLARRGRHRRHQAGAD